MKGATKSLFAHTKVCKSSDVVMLKGKKRALQKDLISKISSTKNFRKPLKLTLTPHVLYIITKCAAREKDLNVLFQSYNIILYIILVVLFFINIF